jgi:hypothetical protein
MKTPQRVDEIVKKLVSRFAAAIASPFERSATIVAAPKMSVTLSFHHPRTPMLRRLKAMVQSSPVLNIRAGV